MEDTKMGNNNFLTKLGQKSSQILEAMGLWPSIVAISGLVVMIFTGIILRYFGFPLAFVEEYTGYLVMLLVMMGTSWVAKQKGHIDINLIPNLLRPRARIYLETLNFLVAMVVIALIFATMIPFIKYNFETGRTSWTFMRTLLAPVQLIMPIGLALFFIQTLVLFVNKVKTLFVRQ